MTPKPCPPALKTLQKCGFHNSTAGSQTGGGRLLLLRLWLWLLLLPQP